MACGMLALISSNMYAQKSYIFLADGVEEVEATATIDALRRAGMDVISVSITENPMVTGATGQKLVADSLMSQVDFADADWIIVPGGVPGAPNLHSNQQVNSIIQIHNANDGRIASIWASRCAGSVGSVEGKEGHVLPRPGRRACKRWRGV